MNFTVRKNEQYNSSEIYFDEIPGKAVRENLKAIGFRWHNAKKCWYGYKTENEIRAAIENNIAKAPAANMNEIVNEYGVKVGDVFMMTWGYEQTNNDFFQVIAVTAKKAKIVEVNPPHESTAVNCMSENRVLTYKEGEMLPRKEKPFWIDDNANGELKSIRDYGRSKPNPWIVIRSKGSYTASRCHAGQRYYESWYA